MRNLFAVNTNKPCILIETMLRSPVIFLILAILYPNCFTEDVDVKLSKVWGPGLQPHLISMPARYFFVQAVDSKNQR